MENRNLRQKQALWLEELYFYDLERIRKGGIKDATRGTLDLAIPVQRFYQSLSETMMETGKELSSVRPAELLEKMEAAWAERLTSVMKEAREKGQAQESPSR